MIWVQLQELPPMPKGDAAGELDVGDGTWTEELREAYADRIVERIGRHIENLSSATVARVVMSPADMEAANPNWVGGDIYAGSCALDQNLLFRPTPASPGTRRRSSSSGTSARAPIPARVSVQAPAIWSRSS